MRRKNMLTKSLAIVTTLTLGLGCFAGCGSSKETAAEKENVETQAKTSGAETESEEEDSEETQTPKKEGGDYADTITLVWYPNESAENCADSRDEIGKIVEEATGKKVEHKLTTDYAITIETLANGSAQIACVMGAEGYIQAKNANDAVEPLVVNSGASGTLEDAMYYSFLSAKEENAKAYADGDSYSIQNIKGKKLSFVSNSSTSGFKVPTNTIISYFDAADLTVDDLMEGGSDMFFSEVLFGGSHPASIFNLISGKCDIAAFSNEEVNRCATCIEGEANQVGAVYEINADAEAPFDAVVGEKFTVISSTPVMNGPFAYNSETLSPEDVAAIQEALTSDEVAANTKIFYSEESGEEGFFKKNGEERFVTVEDSWYDPIRNM